MTEAEWLTADDPDPMLAFLQDRASVRKHRLLGVACCRRAGVVGPGPVARRGIDLAERLADEQGGGEDITRLWSDLLYEGYSGEDGHWRKRAVMARWHHALAVFNALQDGSRFRAGERRPALDAPLQDHHDTLLHFALSEARKEAGPGGDPVFDRPDICRPDLTRVWAEAARAVAFHMRPDDRPDVSLVQMLTQSDACRRLDDWLADLEAAVRHEAGRQAVLARDILGNPFRPATLDPTWHTSTVVALAARMYDSREFSPMPILADALQDGGCGGADVLDHCRSEGPHVRGCWVVDLILGKE